jgi:predicted nucleic acid-binding protein
VIAVDTNVIAYLFLPGEHSSAAREAYRKDPVWVAPVLWRSELRNVLATAVKERGLSVEQAVSVMGAAADLMMGGEYESNSELVLRLAASSGCSAYDCEFVALAHELGVPLVTEDRRIRRSFKDSTIRLRDFGA